MTKQPKKAEPEKESIPRSRQLFEAGFKTQADTARCIKAIIADLAADRISAMEANHLTSATLARMRSFERNARRKKGGK